MVDDGDDDDDVDDDDDDDDDGDGDGDDDGSDDDDDDDDGDDDDDDIGGDDIGLVTMVQVCYYLTNKSVVLQVRLVRELEKKFSGKHIVFVAQVRTLCFPSLRVNFTANYIFVEDYNTLG